MNDREYYQSLGNDKKLIYGFFLEKYELIVVLSNARSRGDCR
ncbi:hypothetical protein MICAC_870004 [Microcystis aeruginosa PCC 9443]|uniref:Uncharacterized protein n=1 Tax=Microcystis aeruginosa PCC 9443 TaxID=1160281 RepID=I4GBP1_MICAE|nr:hypothetical protein MICAC_870004 [Microcystis aeruginosa PCC 9443]